MRIKALRLLLVFFWALTPILARTQASEIYTFKGFAIKTHLYAPLSLGIEPFLGINEKVPFSPRNYVVQAEYGVKTSASIFLSIGYRNGVQKFPLNQSERTQAFRISAGLRRYLNQESNFEGMYVAPFIQFQSGSIRGSGYEFPYQKLAKAISGGSEFGYQFVIGKHFILDAACGPEIGYQYINMPDGLVHGAITSFDFAGSQIFSKPNPEKPSFWGIGLSGYLAAGWLF